MIDPYSVQVFEYNPDIRQTPNNWLACQIFLIGAVQFSFVGFVVK